MKVKRWFGLTLALVLVGPVAQAKGYNGILREDYFMIPNGQGISSPSFTNGISGGNPAGLVYNSRLKAQVGAASFDNSSKNLRESAGLYYGTGDLGVGGEYSNFNDQPLPMNSGLANYGAAFRLPLVNTTVGASGHQRLKGGTTNYDAGVLIELHPRLNLGGMLVDVNHGIHLGAAGLCLAVDPHFDVVVDAAYQISQKVGVVKPGISFHSHTLQLTGAYGHRYTGSNDLFLSKGFTGGIGLKVFDNLFIEYEYKVLAQHWVGLTLRGN